jgi:uncharacterized membrane protein HdeD (DUF308 family)
MATWKRWQDWTSIVAGVVLFVTPFVFSATALTSAAWTAYIGGVLLAIVGLWNLARPSDRAGEWVEGLIGVLLIVSPWVLGFTSLNSMAWSAWIIGIVSLVLAASTLLAAPDRRPTVAAQH